MTISKSETALKSETSKPHQNQLNQSQYKQHNMDKNERMKRSQSQTALSIIPHQKKPLEHQLHTLFSGKLNTHDISSSQYIGLQYPGQRDSGQKYSGQQSPGQEYSGQYPGQQYNRQQDSSQEYQHQSQFQSNRDSTKKNINYTNNNENNATFDVRNNIYYQLSNTTDISLSSTMIAGYIIKKCLPYQALCCPRAIEKLKDLRLKIIRNKYDKFMVNTIEELKMKVSFTYMYICICICICIYNSYYHYHCYDSFCYSFIIVIIMIL
jgi:hypothetical protein